MKSKLGAGEVEDQLRWTFASVGRDCREITQKATQRMPLSTSSEVYRSRFSLSDRLAVVFLS